MFDEKYKEITAYRIKKRISGVPQCREVISQNTMDKYTRNVSENQKDLERWRTYWDALYDFRRRYLTNSDYNRGRQLNRVVTDVNGKRKRQVDIVRENGKTPIVVNIVREVVRAILGQYRNNPSRTTVYTKKDKKDEGEMLTLGLHSALDLNNFREIDAQQLETYLLCGAAFTRVNTKFYPYTQQYDVEIDNVNPCFMFFNTDTRDLRGNDLSLIGEIVECTVEDVIHTYAHTYEEALAMERLFDYVAEDGVTNDGKGLSGDIVRNSDFYTPSSPDRVKLYIGWSKRNRFVVYTKDPIDGTRDTIKGDYKKIIQDIDKYNTERYNFLADNGLTPEEATASLIKYDIVNEDYWEYKVLTYKGECLAQGESPFAHKSHPYSVLLSPLINGEVWGLVEDLIDIQDVINQNFMVMKWIVEQSAKGLLIIDKKTMMDSSYDITDISRAWTEVGGVLALDLKPGIPLPTEINSTANRNVQDLLTMSLQLIEKVSGVSQALKGEAPSSGTPAALYAQQSQNSSLNILNAMKCFDNFIKGRDEKVLKVILEIYETGRYIDVYNDAVMDGNQEWNAENVKDVPFRLAIVRGQDTPLYSFMVQDELMKLLQAGVIDVKTYLGKSPLPYAKDILNDLEKNMQQAQESQQMQANQITNQ